MNDDSTTEDAAEVEVPVDVEIAAIGAVQAALEPLNDAARKRVLRWANERYV